MQNETYQGFEQGPIRPPSEAGSLLLRVTRNCPWNKCRFCPVYKGTRFSLRPVEHVLRDLEAVYRAVQAIQGGYRPPDAAGDPAAWQAARHWLQHGGRQVFLQDADSLVLKPSHVLTILLRLQELFPGVRRVTSYARSRTLARLTSADLAAMRQAGLNRLHVGLESGADEVLELMRKGATRAQQIAAGQKVKQAGIELSLYYMPGLGGRALWEAGHSGRPMPGRRPRRSGRSSPTLSACAPWLFPCIPRYTRILRPDASPNPRTWRWPGNCCYFWNRWMGCTVSLKATTS